MLIEAPHFCRRSGDNDGKLWALDLACRVYETELRSDEISQPKN